jgi:hypothetical protein
MKRGQFFVDLLRLLHITLTSSRRRRRTRGLSPEATRLFRPLQEALEDRAGPTCPGPVSDRIYCQIKAVWILAW